MDSAVAINFKRCLEVASFLRGIKLPQELVRQTLFSSDRVVVGNFNLLLVAICHQTQQISGIIEGKWYRGWDYLQRSLNGYCRRNLDILDVDSWRTLSPERLERVLAPPMPGVGLLDVRSRVELIHDLGYRMTHAGYSSFEELYHAVNGRCCGARSITGFLKYTQAYSDPVEKKARLLIGLLRDAHGWGFDDAHELGAPVDYHEIRGHLRIGTVVINDSALKERLKSDRVSDGEDQVIRAAVSTAIDSIAQYIEGGDPLKVHYMLWKYFRAICRRYEPNCCVRGALALHELDPAYIESFEASTRSSGCAFSSCCDSFKAKNFPTEYDYNGTYY
jgi:hypothetical protein